jgi:hypothetical protein
MSCEQADGSLRASTEQSEHWNDSIFGIAETTNRHTFEQIDKKQEQNQTHSNAMHDACCVIQPVTMAALLPLVAARSLSGDETAREREAFGMRQDSGITMKQRFSQLRSPARVKLAYRNQTRTRKLQIPLSYFASRGLTITRN